MGISQTPIAGDESGANWRGIDWTEYTHLVDLGSGVRVSYVDIGSGDGPPVLLVHGLGGSWRMWLENIMSLSARHRVIAVDLPGFGDSPVVEDMLTFAHYAALVRDFCQAIELDSVVAVGNSLGGWISVELANTTPSLVSGLVLVDSAGIPPNRGERVRALAMLRMADRLIPWSCRNRDLLARRPLLRRRALAFAITRGDLIAPDLALHLLPATPSPAFRPVLEAAFKAWDPEWCDNLKSMDVPTLVIWGERDRQLPLRHATQWARFIRGARVEVVPGAGHLPMVESPRVFNAYVHEFLQELTGARSGAEDATG